MSQRNPAFNLSEWSKPAQTARAPGIVC